MFLSLYTKVCKSITSILHCVSNSKSPSNPPIMFNYYSSSSKFAQPVHVNNAIKFPQIRDCHPCFLKKIVWHKHNKPPFHEFLVFYASKDGEKIVGLVERRVNYTEKRPPMKVIVQKDYTVRLAGDKERPGPGDIQEGVVLPEYLAEADIDAINAELLQAEPDGSLDTPPPPASSPPEDGSDRPNRNVVPLTQGMSSVSSSNSSSISSSLGSDPEAIDQFIFSYNGNDKFVDHYEEGNHHKMYVLSIPEGKFTVAELCALARAVQKYRPKYTLLEYQCHWFARTIFETIVANVEIAPRATWHVTKAFNCGYFGRLPTPLYPGFNKSSNRQGYINMFDDAWSVELSKFEEEREARELPERLRRAAEARAALEAQERERAERERERAERERERAERERERAERERERAERERERAEQQRDQALASAERIKIEIAALRSQLRPEA